MDDNNRPKRNTGKRKRYSEDDYWDSIFSIIDNEQDDYSVDEPLIKKQKTGYYNDLPREQFEVTHIRDLIKLGFMYNPDNDNPFFRKLFKLIVPLMKLDKLVGMNEIKEKLVGQIMYFVQGFHERDFDGAMLHCAIYGPPGTGKTHVSSIIGEIYRCLGFLNSDKVTLAKRTDFIADYLGQTANKTKKFLDKAKGGVLIIDEIYSLSSGNQDHDSYAKEAIDTINQYLSENKKDLLCIVIGYEKDVQRCFFDLNQGLDRRFPYRYTIEPYTNTELKEIFVYQVQQGGWKLSDPVALAPIIVEKIQGKQRYFKNFGGDTDNYFLACKTARSKRLFGLVLNEDQKFILEQPDIQEGMNVFVKDQDSKPQDNTVFESMMYL